MWVKKHVMSYLLLHESAPDSTWCWKKRNLFIFMNWKPHRYLTLECDPSLGLNYGGSHFLENTYFYELLNINTVAVGQKFPNLSQLVKQVEITDARNLFNYKAE